MTFSLSPGVNSLESELRAIGSKEPILDTLRDASQLVSISGLSSDLHSKMASTYDSGWGGALEAMEQPDCLPRGLPHSGGSSVQMQLWSTNDSAALPAAPSSASLSSVASTNSITNAVTAAAAGVVMDEPCAWTNVHGQATTTMPAMRSMTTAAATGTTNSSNNNTTTNNNSSATPPTTTTTTTTTNEAAQPQQQQQQQQPSLQQQQQQPQPFLLSPQDYAGLQPMTTWFMPSPNGAGGFTQCVALPALGNPQNAALLPLPAPASSSTQSATHVDCGATTTNTMPAGYQAVWQPSTTAAATNMNIQTAMNNGTQSVQEMPRWVPYMPGQHLIQLPQAFAMATQPAATATVNNNNNNSNMSVNEISGQAQVLHHDPSSMFLPMGPGMPYVLLMPTATTTATAPTVQQQQQQQQMQSSWASLPPPPPTLQPASIQTPSNHALPSNASTPQARSSERLTQGNSNTAQPTQNAASNATSYTTQSPSHAVSSLPAVTPPLGPLLYAPAPLMQPHTLIQQQQQQGGMMMMSGVEKEARATPAYVSPSQQQQQQQHFLPPPPPPPLPGVEPMHTLPSQVPPAINRPITLPTPPWLLPAPTSTSSTSTTTVCSTAGMPQTQNAPSTTHAAQTTPHVKAWMGINDQWRPLVYGY